MRKEGVRPWEDPIYGGQLSNVGDLNEVEYTSLLQACLFKNTNMITLPQAVNIMKASLVELRTPPPSPTKGVLERHSQPYSDSLPHTLRQISQPSSHSIARRLRERSHLPSSGTQKGSLDLTISSTDETAPSASPTPPHKQKRTSKAVHDTIVPLTINLPPLSQDPFTLRDWNYSTVSDDYQDIFRNCVLVTDGSLFGRPLCNMYSIIRGMQCMQFLLIRFQF